MLIICPSCATSYEVQANSLPPHGQVRCLRCRAVWSPHLHQADKLLAAAAAIAADFDFQHEANPSVVDGIPQAEPAADIVSSDSLSDPYTAEIGPADEVAECSFGAESAAAEPEPDHFLLAADEPALDPELDHPLDVFEGAPVNPGSGSGTVTEIIDQEADHFPAVAENATAHLLPVTSIFVEVVPLDSRLDHAAACENHAGVDADVLPMPLAPNEQLESLLSETLAADQTVGMLGDGERLPANFFTEADESPAGHAVDMFEEEPSPNRGYLAVMSEEARGVALPGVEKCSVDMICVKLEAALSEQAELAAREQPIDVRAGYYDSRFLQHVENIERRTTSRSRRKAKVEARSLNMPRQRFIPRWPLSNLHSGIVALALLDIFLVGWRTDIVRKLPQTASFYALTGLPVNLRGLAFENITTSAVRDEGTPVLVVEGNVVNDTRKNLRVPQIRFVVRDAAAQEIYSWTASAARTSLPPGQAATFRARLASPPPGAHDLVLRFVGRCDDIAVIR